AEDGNLFRLYCELRPGDVRELSWWSHNHHMTLFVKVTEDKKVDRLEGIFFVRRLRASSVAPLYLEGDDAKTALGIFVAYWQKAFDGRDQQITPDLLAIAYAGLSAQFGVELSPLSAGPGG
ncbi:MAG TPA: hypothetical protein VEW03_14985, partial [Longimicrobiaceae bacterium]|nr:hypothetical protein [Longimicrobiaceae bacterium]